MFIHHHKLFGASYSLTLSSSFLFLIPILCVLFLTINFMMPVTVGYWDCRGLCEPIRFILIQAGVEFEDKRYKSKEEWAADKFSLGFEFPNMPYLIDEEGKFTQVSHNYLR